ncbi:capsule assembly Wzi family protein [Dyadobacter sp. CY312]|uniref:capsule assembly Wzi family protein n=1 Tax=Dyadobacter sp. CY312 TaxID=2907303 RepID=UPI001F193973|nr:capsule assembly Wzi family protein [Dyadobacter sp. CY312]MCE7041265.1 capsule assembly Wzi family protein [Dyadobacter sp. CY312]
MRGIFTLLFFSFAIVINVSAQDSTFYYSANIQGALSGTNTPYWLQANQYGAIPTEGSFLNAQIGVYKKYNRNNPRFFQWSAGVEGVATLGNTRDIFFTDLYLAGKAGPVELSIGQQKDVVGLGDTLLTSGFFALSNNARPYPKIRISTPNFVNIIPGNDLLAFSFSYSDGILGSARITYGNTNRVPQIYMHHKAIYLRVGGPSHKISLFAGFNHQAMWGGEEKIFSGGLKRNVAYEYVVFGKPWAASRVGNHFGTIDLAAQLNGHKWNLYIYRQSIYEDGSLSNLSSIADGLNGIRLKRVKSRELQPGIRLNTLLLEYIYTKSQGGNVFDFSTGVFGNDDYYNHYVYAQGWSYRGRSLGNPLIGPQVMNREGVPTNYRDYTVNNRISGIHIGSELSWDETTILVKGTFTKNFGTYRREFQPSLSQSSFIVKAERPFPIWNRSLFSISLAADFGKLYTSNSAIMIGWRKNGFLGK